MNILIATESVRFGGTDTFSLTLAREFERLGHKASILLNSDHTDVDEYRKQVLPDRLFFFPFPSLQQYFLECGLLCRLMKPITLSILAFRVSSWTSKLLVRNGFDAIVVVNGSFPGGFLTYSLMMLPRFNGNIPVLYTIHNYPLYSKGLRLYAIFFERLVPQKTSLSILTVSEACKIALESGSVHGLPIEVQHNGVVDQNPEAKCANAPKDVVRLVFVGNLEQRKGVHILLDAFAQLQCSPNKTYELHLYGKRVDAHYGDQIQSMIQQVDGVFWHGMEADKTKMYSGKHLLILPSVCYESFGLVLIEAMMFGLPVVASDGLGMREIFTIDPQYSPGEMFTLGDSVALVRAIEQVLGVDYEVYSHNARKLYDIYFSSVRMAGEFDRRLRQMLDNNVLKEML